MLVNRRRPLPLGPALEPEAVCGLWAVARDPRYRPGDAPQT